MFGVRGTKQRFKEGTPLHYGLKKDKEETKFRINNYTAQVLTGPDTCVAYLKKFTKDDTCKECIEATDTMMHTIFECPTFSELRMMIRLPLQNKTDDLSGKGLDELDPYDLRVPVNS